jgi:hypothetical protein
VRLLLAHPHPLPDGALHAKYARDGGYADCFVLDMQRDVTLAEFIETFYTTWLFKLERFILAWLVRKPSTDFEARALARGQRATFAAWSIEAQAEGQLLMRDFQDKTRSCFIVSPIPGNNPGTRLLFGTGIKPVAAGTTGAQRLGAGFRALMPFHRFYSRALLGAAVTRLSRAR